MIEIIKNINNLKDSDINEKIIRVKAIIRNDKDELLLGHSYCEYQFPGGHVEENEELLPALKRELLEETGLIYDTSNLEPFAVASFYHKDVLGDGINTKVVIYYYEIRDSRVPNLANTNYTEEELDGNFKLRYIPISIVEDVIKRNIYTCGDGEGIGQEMLDVLSYYLKIVE